MLYPSTFQTLMMMIDQMATSGDVSHPIGETPTQDRT